MLQDCGKTLVIDDLKYLNVGKINPLGKGLQKVKKGKS